MSVQSIKRLLLDNSDDTAFFKNWALLAKKAKAYYQSPECRFFHALFESVMKETLSDDDSEKPELHILIAFLDLCNSILASASEGSTRRYLVSCLKDKHILTRCKMQILRDIPQQGALAKRCDELRHHLNFVVPEGES
jgi:hypothetical protein